jgi:hypothetical protein
MKNVYNFHEVLRFPHGKLDSEKFNLDDFEDVMILFHYTRSYLWMIK